MKTFSLAISFLTAIPMPGVGVASDQEMNQTVAFFPMVGLLVGFLNTTVLIIAANLWSPQVGAWLWLAANALLTGGLHLDGWMDTFDALGSRKGRSEMLAIMKDSRIGAMGAIAAVLLLGLKWTALSHPSMSLAALAFAPVIGRMSLVLVTQGFPYGRDTGLGKALKSGSLSPLGWILAAGTATAGAALLGYRGVWASVVALALGYLWAYALSKKLGGLTGDTYGAVNELVEIAFLLGVLCKVSI